MTDASPSPTLTRPALPPEKLDWHDEDHRNNFEYLIHLVRQDEWEVLSEVLGDWRMNTIIVFEYASRFHPECLPALCQHSPQSLDVDSQWVFRHAAGFCAPTAIETLFPLHTPLQIRQAVDIMTGRVGMHRNDLPARALPTPDTLGLLLDGDLQEKWMAKWGPEILPRTHAKRVGDTLGRALPEADPAPVPKPPRL
jgi:hypothetical protein